MQAAANRDPASNGVAERSADTAFGAGDALAAIDRYVECLMPERGMPGVALAITDRDGLLATRDYGYADLGALTPVDGETLFEYGSIGKSFTAICLLQLAEEGVVDLHAPAADYLPWFAVGATHAPIAIHHLLTHTAGLIEGSDLAVDSRYEVWALRESVAAPPGALAHYSNVGYKVLGFLLEAVTGKPYPRLVRERILDPLGMDRSAGQITHDLRRRLAVGYVPFYDDRPWRPAHGHVPAAWLETTTGDGSIAGTAADLAAYLRMLLNEGAGPRGRILSPEGFSRLIAPHVEMGPDGAYGYGIASWEVDRRRQFGHGGDMVGYVSAMWGDRDAGLGVVAVSNGMADVEPIVAYALRCLVAEAAGPLPDAPPVMPAFNAAEFAGRYLGETSDLTVEADGERLTLLAGSGRIPLEPARLPPLTDAFVADHPDWALFPLRFGRDGAGGVVELMHGGDWYAADAYEGTRVFATPAEWAAYPGHYRSWNPWVSNFRIVCRKGELLMISPTGAEQALTSDGESFRLGDDPLSPERIAFDTVVEGMALRARLAGGAEYYRFFTP